MCGVNIGVLKDDRLSGSRIDGERCDVAFARTEHFYPFNVLDAGSHGRRHARTVAEVDELSVGMNVNRASALNRDAFVSYPPQDPELSDRRHTVAARSCRLRGEWP